MNYSIFCYSQKFLFFLINIFFITKIKDKINQYHKVENNKMFNLVKGFASGFLLKNNYKFSAGYFSHRQTEDNNDSTPFDFSE